MQKSYDDIAEWYQAKMGDMSSSASNWAFPSLLTLLGDVVGHCVCDLGCGEGRVSRLVAKQRATVLGIDQSAKLITLAKQAEICVHKSGHITACYRPI